MNVQRTEDLPDPRNNIDLPTDGLKISKEEEREEEDGYVCIYRFNKEDFTIGGILMEELLQMDDVLIASYEVRHPLIFEMHLVIKCVKTTVPDQVLLQSFKLVLDRITRTKKMVTMELKKECEKNPSSLPLIMDEIDKEYIFSINDDDNNEEESMNIDLMNE